MGRVNLEMKKVTFNFPTALMGEVEKFCEVNTLPVTQGIHMLIRYGLDYHYMISNVPDMVRIMNDYEKRHKRVTAKKVSK